MSEVELHLIRQRMASGRLAKAGRGELAAPLPAGYARRPSGEAALDPDEQVQAVVRLVFRLFDELGTVHSVLRFLVGHQVRIGMRERSGPGKGEVVWRAPHQQGLVNMLRNPAYAGIYAYGRSRTDRSRRLPGREHSGRVRALEAGSGWSVSGARGRPISAWSSTSVTRHGWPPTGPAPTRPGRLAAARRCWAGWWSAASAVTACS